MIGSTNEQINEGYPLSWLNSQHGYPKISKSGFLKPNMMHKVTKLIQYVPPAESPAKITHFGKIPNYGRHCFMIQQYAYQTSFN